MSNVAFNNEIQQRHLLESSDRIMNSMKIHTSHYYDNFITICEHFFLDFATKFLFWKFTRN